KEGYHDLLTPQVRSNILTQPEHLKNYVAEGKLRLSLRDAVVLTLENNSGIRIQETQVELSKFSVLAAHSPFDPSLLTSYNINSTSSPATSVLQGTQGSPTVNTITQFAQVGYTQTLETGTNFQANLSSNNFFTNNANNFFNPYVTSTLNLQFTQPLLRNGW